MSSLRRTLVGLVATSVVGAGLALAGAAPAHATVGTVDTGSAISRTEIVERALSWTTERVPYSESVYWPRTAPRAGTGHSYRQDCSGFVSMAWDLPTSAVTGNFVSSSSAYDTRLASYASLQRGDLLGISGHVVLFLGWSADDNGRHRYFDMVSEAHTGTVASVNTDQDLDGYWSTYAPYTYRHAVADVPRTAPFGGGRTDEVSLSASGHVIHGWRLTPTAPWQSQDLTALRRFPILRTAPALTSPAPGQLVAIGTGQGGALIELAYAPSTGWTVRTLTATGTVYGIDASATGSRIDIVGRQVGSTPADGTGLLWHATLVGATWSGWLRPGAQPPSLLGDPAIAGGPGVVDTVVESAAGTLLLGSWDTATTAWVWSAPFGPARVSTQPAVSRGSDGTLTVLATIGGVLEQDSLAPGATAWTGWQAPGTTAAAPATRALAVTRSAAPVRRAVAPAHL